MTYTSASNRSNIVSTANPFPSGLADHQRAALGCDGCGAVGAAVVDHDDVPVRRLAAEIVDDLADGPLFVEARNQQHTLDGAPYAGRCPTDRRRSSSARSGSGRSRSWIVTASLFLRVRRKIVEPACQRLSNTREDGLPEGRIQDGLSPRQNGYQQRIEKGNLVLGLLASLQIPWRSPTSRRTCDVHVPGHHASEPHGVAEALPGGLGIPAIVPEVGVDRAVE